MQSIEDQNDTRKCILENCNCTKVLHEPDCKVEVLHKWVTIDSSKNDIKKIELIYNCIFNILLMLPFDCRYTRNWTNNKIHIKTSWDFENSLGSLLHWTQI